MQLFGIVGVLLLRRSLFMCLQADIRKNLPRPPEPGGSFRFKKCYPLLTGSKSSFF